MFAAHFAAGLALKSAAPKVRTWVLLTGAFLPDLAWIVLARAGIEPEDAVPYFDGWFRAAVYKGSPNFRHFK